MIDYEKLMALMANDEQLVDRFVEMFKQQMPELLDKLNQAIDKENWEEAELAAHDIKSQCRYVGLEQFAKLAEQIEGGCLRKKINPDTIHELERSLSNLNQI